MLNNYLSYHKKTHRNLLAFKTFFLFLIIKKILVAQIAYCDYAPSNTCVKLSSICILCEHSALSNQVNKLILL